MTEDQVQAVRRVLAASRTAGLRALLDAATPALAVSLGVPRAATLVRTPAGELLAAAAVDGGAPVASAGPPDWPGATTLRRALGAEGELVLVYVPVSAGDDALAETLLDLLALAVEREVVLAAQRRLTDLFTSGPVVVFRWKNAPGWPVEHVSPNVTAQFGWTVQALEGQPYAPLVHPDDLERVGREVAQEVERGGSYFEQQYRLVDVHGVARPVYDFTHVVRDARGAVTHFHGYLFDDSRRHDAERQRGELELKLQQAQKLEAVATLASGVAHDFNNALASVLAHLALARQRTDDARAVEDLDFAAESARHGRDVARQMLLFSRAMSAPRAPVLLGPVARGAVELARPSLSANVQLALSIDAAVPPVLGEPTQLEQVVLNLVTNAAHAMPTGGVLEVSLGVAPAGPGPLAGRRCARLRVKDTGPGMPPDVLRRAFEPFFTTRPIGKGTGLGLAMVHGIITSHEGQVTLDSRVGEGTEASVWLPCTETPVPTREVPAADDVQGAGQRIAVVDDNVPLARATARLLEALGFSARVFPAGQALLDALDAEPHAVDLILTDQSMPDLTGVELARALRARGVTAPIVIITGLITSVDTSGIAPPLEVLGKPVPGDELGRALLRLLHAKR